MSFQTSKEVGLSEQVTECAQMQFQDGEIVKENKIDELVKQAKTALQSTAQNIWKLGQITTEAGELGYSVRQFAKKAGISHTHLNTCVHFYRKYPSLDKVTSESLPTLKDIKKNLANPVGTEGGNLVSTTPELGFDFQRMWTLLSLLHYHIRRGRPYEAMKTARELIDRGMVGQCWNELEVCSTEETTDSIAILTVDVLFRKVRDGVGRTSTNAGIAERCAMIAAFTLASAPKDRTTDDTVVLDRIRHQLGLVGSAVDDLLNEPFTPPSPADIKMHRGGKKGVEGELHMAQIGSVTEGKDAKYAEFRKKFDAMVEDVMRSWEMMLEEE